MAPRPTKCGVKDHQPYDIITLCASRAFFENPGAIAVEMEMEAVVKNMARDHGIKIKNAVDLRALAEQLDLARYDLNKVAITVLRKHVDVVRPEKKVEWYDDYWKRWSRKLTTEKVRFATVDAYLCLLVGSGMYDVTVHGDDEAKAKKKNMEKAKKTKKLIYSNHILHGNIFGNFVPPEKVRFLGWLSAHDSLPTNLLSDWASMVKPCETTFLSYLGWRIMLGFLMGNFFFDWGTVDSFTNDPSSTKAFWCLPDEVKVKINVNGMCNLGDQVIGGGGVIRNSVGHFV
ncbi:hypothetical protein Lal_00050252 [Lupinus albus]|nr:hypothetical protein Lal_00050252 [Lupinus albus]